MHYCDDFGVSRTAFEGGLGGRPAHDEWTLIRNAISTALWRFPEARAAVRLAMDAIGQSLLDQGP